ncbi:MAG: hypothetical protein AAGA54_36570 [Myxococcota bacterium]
MLALPASIVITLTVASNGDAPLSAEAFTPPQWTEASLRDAGLGQPQDDGGHWDASAVQAPVVPAAKGDGPAVFFINFDGATLISGADDARSNVTTIAGMAGEYPAFGGTEGYRASILQAARDDFAAFDVIVTDERPRSGDYVMAMVGPKETDDPNRLGAAALDCDDAKTRNNVVFAYISADEGRTPDVVATTVSHEFAHSLGIEHVEDTGDIMFAKNLGGDPSFRNACVAVVGDNKCASVHARHCDEGLQNAYAELFSRLGPATPSGDNASVRIIAPLEGENFDVDEPFDVVLETDDGVVIERAALFVNDELSGEDDRAPFGWTVPEPGEGAYGLQVLIQDAQGVTRASNVVEITIGRTSTKTDAGGALPGEYGRGLDDAQGCNLGASSGSSGFGMMGVTLLMLCASRHRRFA